MKIQFYLTNHINKRDPKDVAQVKAEEKVEKRKRGRPRKDATLETTTAPKTTPTTTPKSQKEKGPELRQKMIRIMKATPTISKAELADLLRITVDGVTYHVRILRKELGVHWEGSSMKGRWVIPE